jgi:tRNA pseudouridine38-40 synthase
MRNIRLTLAYDGSDFSGWQRQDNARSVQAELEIALARMHGHPVPTVAAGRTDAGVHAKGQVANFYTDIASIPAPRFLLALNKLMARDLRVLDAIEVGEDFHSRYDARLRRYRYFTACGGPPDPVRLRYAHFLHRRPDLGVLNAMASRLLGETDFSALSSARDESLSRSRFVHEASFRWEGDLLVFEVAANAFLLRMVRSIVGSLFDFEAAGKGADDFAALIASKDRSAAGATAPARGLFLWNVEYYASPTRPGRGAYWALRNLAEDAAAEDAAAEDTAAEDAAAEDGADARGSWEEVNGGGKASDLGAKPTRLVPGLGRVEA